jgi:hypothetical protein
MKRYGGRLIIIMCGAIWLSCAAGQKVMLQEPVAGKSLLAGAVLVENLGLEDVYEAKTGKITVVIVGKWQENGKEKTAGFRVRTDEKGYFFLQNVNPGSWLIKGIEVDVGFSMHLLITSRWEGNTQIFEPAGTIIDDIVRVWPKAEEKKVIDLGIHYIRLEFSGQIHDQKFSRLQDTRLGLKDKTYTMSAPALYFSAKYPEWGWFK